LGRAIKRRSGAGNKLQGRKRSTPKSRNAPKATRNRSASIAGQETVVARVTHERDEALEQQTATSEVLRIISSSPGELKLVFQAILENATRICEANFGAMALIEGDAFRNVAMHNVPPAFAEWRQRHPVFRPGPDTALGSLARTKQVVAVEDLKTERAHITRDPVRVAMVELGGARTFISVPMLKDDVLIGTIQIYRQEVRPFTGKQIALVQNFAAQAVIAIENTRLLNGLRQRTTDLGEALEQQTATADVLHVISSSPGDLKPVFDAILENATRICQASFGTLHLAEGMSTARSLPIMCRPPTPKCDSATQS
jgi:transcriptional regulator with GAF, ATPase, and Fis domain